MERLTDRASILFDTTSSTSATGDDFGTRTKQVTLVQPVTFNDNRPRKYRVNRVILSPEIPNIYSYGSFNNTQMRISINGGVAWSIVQFSNGVFTINMIQDSITNAFAQTGSLVVGGIPVIVSYNPATHFVYVTLQSTALTAGQVGVDFGFSSFYQLLGFDTPAHSKFIADGTYTAQGIPNLDSQGTSILVSMDIIQGARYKNGVFSNIVCRVPIVVAASQVEIIYPSGSTGFISDWIKSSIPSTIMTYTIDYISEKTGSPIVFLFGNATLEIEIANT